MSPIVTLNESESDVFEEKCNELAEQGYILQSCYCGFFGRDGYTPVSLWYAIFALPEAVQNIYKN